MFTIFASVALSALSYVSTPVEILVVDPQGRPVPNVVVWTESDTSENAPSTYGWPDMMEQRDRQFHPYILLVQKGARVEFPNRDRFRHHVYSFSRGNRFELELYGTEEKRFVQFATEGVAAIGCNIHDEMIGYIRVVDTSLAAMTDEDGMARLGTADATERQVSIWHPDSNGGDDLTAIWRGETLTVTIDTDDHHKTTSAMTH